MFRDDYGRVYHVAIPFGLGDHLRLGQCDLPGKDLHALNAHGAVACFGGSQIHNGIGPDGVVLLQGQRTGGGFNGEVGSGAGLIGDTLSGKAVAGHGDENTLDGRGLTGTESLNA